MVNRSATPSHWSTSKRQLSLADKPLIMGILNVTPDSFSDGGQFDQVQLAQRQALRMQDQGADIIDIGGESTRPGSAPVDADEERRRVIPVIESLAGKLSIPISIDTSKSVVAIEATQAGAEIINDVTGLEGDAAMVDAARESSAGICAMHMRGTPQTMQNDLRYDNVVEEIYDYLCQRREALLDAGFEREKICLDPGIGFGKSHQQNIELMQHAGRFLQTGCPILVGHSRKGFIGKLAGSSIQQRDAGTLGATLALAARGIQIVRVHEVQQTKAALKLFQTIGTV